MASSDPPTHGPTDGPTDGGVAVDAVTALGTSLSRPDGRIATLADAAAAGTLLVVVVEHGSAVCIDALTALRDTGARLVVVSQGRPEAAAALVARTRLDERQVLVEPSPHPVSDALAATGVPTFALVEGLELVAWQDGWDRDLIASLIERAGGRLPRPEGVSDRAEPTPSRLTLDEETRTTREADDAAQ